MNGEESNEQPEIEIITETGPKSLRNPVVRASSLRQIPLLEGMTTSDSLLIAQNANEIKFNPGDIIIKEGDTSYGMFLIQKGTAIVSEHSKQISSMKAGDYFGENSFMFKDRKQTFTVTAKDSVVCYHLKSEIFKKLNIHSPNKSIIEGRRKPVHGEQIKSKYTPGKPSVSVVDSDFVVTKTKETIIFLKNKLKETIIFEKLSDRQLDDVVANMHHKTIHINDLLTTQGQKGKEFFIVEHGEFDVIVDNQIIASAGPGTSIGQIALLHEIIHESTLKFKTPGTVQVLSQLSYQSMVTGQSEFRYAECKKYLKSIKIFDPLNDEQLNKISESINEIIFEKDDIIFNQGDTPDLLYMIKEGIVKLIHKNEDGSVKSVKELKSGSHFGEQALLSSSPRDVTAIVEQKLKCFTIKADEFVIILGPLGDLISRKLSHRRSIFSSIKKPVELEKPEFNDLKEIGILGKGAFGLVTLVRDRKTKKTYALKAVLKSKVVKGKQEHHIISERKTLLKIQHPFIVNLIRTFRDKKYVYFLIEPVLGGELFQILRSRNAFDEDTARFYAASIVLVFEYLHERDIIYRDLKPENLMVCDDGYIKLTDLGFAKQIDGNKMTYTLCGTPDYLAPEILLSKGHNKGVDQQTLGIFIFEMVAGYPPFVSEDRHEIYKKIIRGTVNYPGYFSKELKNLISGLLESRPALRLGTIKGGADTIKMHPQFKDFSQNSLLKKEIIAPIIIPVKSEEDCSNFKTTHIKKDKNLKTDDDLKGENSKQDEDF